MKTEFTKSKIIGSSYLVIELELEALMAYIKTSKSEFVTARKLAARAAKSNKNKAFAHYTNIANNLSRALTIAENAANKRGL